MDNQLAHNDFYCSLPMANCEARAHQRALSRIASRMLRWDRRDASDLLALVEEYDDIVGRLRRGGYEHGYDQHSPLDRVPSHPLPDEVEGLECIWACDSSGRMLVGPGGEMSVCTVQDITG